MENKFYKFCMDNNYTGHIAVSQLGVHFKISSGIFSCSQTVTHDNMCLLEGTSSDFLDKVLCNLKRMMDNAKI